MIGRRGLLLLWILVHSLSLAPVSSSQEDFVRGDVACYNCSALNNAVTLMNYLFSPNAFEPTCMDAADANDDGAVNIADVVLILCQMFSPACNMGLPPPFLDCGPDPTPDTLDCQLFDCP